MEMKGAAMSELYKAKQEVEQVCFAYDKAYDNNLNLKANPDIFIAAYSIAGKVVDVVE